MREIMQVLTVIFGIVFATILLIVVPVALIDYLDCKGFSSTGYEIKWYWGCYANVDGKWIPKQYVYGTAHEVRMKDKK